MNETTIAVRTYFHAKRKELMALAELPVCKHPSLIGGHREQIYRTYLSDLLPKRFSVGRGMVYGAASRSKEADIVIWDSSSYPSLPLLDHSFFFAESVKAVIECKSRWSRENFEDVLEKCRAVDAIVPMKEPNLEDVVLCLQEQVAALAHGVDYSGALLAKHQIGTAAMFLTGGQGVTPKKLIAMCTDAIEFDWPDLIIFVETGLLVTKDKSGQHRGGGRLEFYKYQDNALLGFSIALLRLIQDRVTYADAPFFMEPYAFQILDSKPAYAKNFKMRRLSVGRRIFMG